jgi:hypothetical protein
MVLVIDDIIWRLQKMGIGNDGVDGGGWYQGLREDAATADGHDYGTSANGHADGRKCDEEGAMCAVFCV